MQGLKGPYFLFLCKNFWYVVDYGTLITNTKVKTNFWPPIPLKMKKKYFYLRNKDVSIEFFLALASQYSIAVKLMLYWRLTSAKRMLYWHLVGTLYYDDRSLFFILKNWHIQGALIKDISKKFCIVIGSLWDSCVLFQ